ncbi:MAG: STAS domain-containing protein [Eubacteriales bacterium]
MEFHTRVIEDTIIAKIVGELDHHTSEDIRNQMDYLLSMNGVKNVIFDLSQLTFMDSSGVGMFMGRYKKVKALKGVPLLVSIPLSIRKLFQMSGLFNIYGECSNIEDGLNKVRRGKHE